MKALPSNEHLALVDIVSFPFRINRISKNSAYAAIPYLSQDSPPGVVSAAAFFISCRVKGYAASVIFSAAVFVMPLVLSAIGFEFMDHFLANPLLIGNVI